MGAHNWMAVVSVLPLGEGGMCVLQSNVCVYPLPNPTSISILASLVKGRRLWKTHI